jgi:hypothetical protein
MKIRIGNIWNELGRADLLLITSNSVIKKDRSLVMGAGAAKDALERFPNISHYYGDLIYNWDKMNRAADYGVLKGYVDAVSGTEIGLFQTKRNWRDPSDIKLIHLGVRSLSTITSAYKRIVINFPGIGYGQLKATDVIPIIAALPDHVKFYCRDQSELL